MRARLASVIAVLGMAALVLLSGCGNLAPVASFSCTPSSGQSPLAVAFDASSSQDPDGAIVSHQWAFGDGSSGTGVTASHVYIATGNRSYTVTLAVTDNDGKRATASRVISVTPPPPDSPPVASFTCNPTSGEAPLDVSFNATASHDSDGSIVSYKWDFGDGGSDTGVMTSHTYQSPGIYTAVLRVTDDDARTDTASRSITVTGVINQPPVAAFSYVRDPLDTHSFHFDASSSTDPDGTLTHWAWDFGDNSGLTVSQSLQVMSHRYLMPGTYDVILTVYDSGGMSDSVTHTVTVPMSPGNQAPVAEFGYSPSSPVAGAEVRFDGSASSDPDGMISAYSWDFGDGHTSDIGPTVYHRYVASGTHAVALQVIDNGGMTDTATCNVTVAGP